MTSLHKPETDDSVLSDYRIAHPVELARLMADLVNSGDQVSVYDSRDVGQCVESRLLAHDGSAGTLEFEILPGPSAARGLVPGVPAIAVAVMAQIKLQFELVPIRIDAAAHRMQARAPGSVVRLQRRDAFRVTPPREAGAQIWIRESVADSREWRASVIDLSATGMAFQWRDTAPPSCGAILQNCRLDIAGFAAITCQLRVSGTRLQGPMDSRFVSVGCEFVSLDSSAARAIQMYVNAAQTRSRARKPALSRASSHS